MRSTRLRSSATVISAFTSPPPYRRTVPWRRQIGAGDVVVPTFPSGAGMFDYEHQPHFSTQETTGMLHPPSGEFHPQQITATKITENVCGLHWTGA